MVAGSVDKPLYTPWQHPAMELMTDRSEPMMDGDAPVVKPGEARSGHNSWIGVELVSGCQ